ncbi:hypothetical protein C7974DRAFT_424374 [Boeremia exigua]|uniref:uncharacterized protein n=1 Tax=Boeremia exigua TaxID=749465 RepID=UPI001E8EC401|nr:uncharacterized protein C7974DRAFT_424374 [Boeremia exigua]KAH6629310.1 hypothetical protein C7974DRAFT_424374 [Boeremia exigua]
MSLEPAQMAGPDHSAATHKTTFALVCMAITLALLAFRIHAAYSTLREHHAAIQTLQAEILKARETEGDRVAILLHMSEIHVLMGAERKAFMAETRARFESLANKTESIAALYDRAVQHELQRRPLAGQGVVADREGVWA